MLGNEADKLSVAYQQPGGRYADNLRRGERSESRPFEWKSVSNEDLIIWDRLVGGCYSG